MRKPRIRHREDRSADGVAVVAKAVDLLEHLGDGRPWRVADLASAAGVSRSATYRILDTLEERGWVHREGAIRRYTIGAALGALGRVSRFPEDLVPIARPFMRALWEAYDETVNLGINVGGRVLYLDLIESLQRLKTTSRVGSSDPIHSTALGKAILALLPPAEATRILSSTARHPRTTRTRVGLEALAEELEATRQRGYAVDDEENELGSRCVAAGVLDSEHRPFAALSVSAPTIRFDEERLELIGRAVIRSSRELTAAFTHRAMSHGASSQSDLGVAGEARG